MEHELINKNVYMEHGKGESGGRRGGGGGGGGGKEGRKREDKFKLLSGLRLIKQE